MNHFIECEPEEVGYDKSRIDVLNQYFQKLIDDDILINASYCIAKNGKTIACNAQGYKSFRKVPGEMMQPETIMNMASVTKLFTAVSIFQLVEDGKIRLDEPMCKYLPQMDVEEFREITIAHMLSHTSGMWPDEACFPKETGHSSWKAIENLKRGDDWITPVVKNGLRRKPGEEWMYNSFGYTLLGALIEKASKENGEDYIMNHVVRPLGMNDTDFDVREDMANKLMIVNEEDEEHLKAYQQAVADGKKYEADKGDYIWMDIPRTSGGLKSNVTDLIKFAKMLANYGRLGDTRVLGRMSIEKMSEQYLHNVPNYCWGAHDQSRLYGLGPDLRRGVAIITSDKFFFHEGWGYLCVAVDLRENLAATWFVPYVNSNKWYPETLLNVKNIIWSGII